MRGANKPSPDLRGQALQAFRSGKKGKAEKMCRALANIPPGRDAKARTYHVLAQLLFLDLDYAEAEGVVLKALGESPRDPALHALKSAIARELGRHAKAEKAAREAISLAPDRLEGHDALVAALLDNGETDRAVEAARNAAKAAPSPASVRPFHTFLGRVLQHAGNMDDALAAFTKALSSGPGNDGTAAELNYRMGNLCHEMGKADQAVGHYEKALSINPKSAEAHAAMVNGLHADGKTQRAKACFRNAVERVPGFTARHFDFLFPPDLQGEGRADGCDVALISPLPTYPNPPFGLSLIKSYVEKNSAFTVKCFDLNALWLKAVVGALRAGTTALRFDKNDELLSAVDLFSNGGDAFFDPAQYTPLAEVFRQFITFTHDTYAGQLNRAYGDHGPTPWYIMSFAKMILARKPTVIGISVTFTEQLGCASVLARHIRNLDKTVKIVFGGGFFNEINLEGYLARPYVDYIVLNAGELPFLNLLNALKRGETPSEVDGLFFNDAETGARVRNPNLMKVKFDDMPFADFSDFDMKSYFNPEPVLPVISSRGCYWRRCTFCDHFASYAGTYKTQSIERVVDEMAHQMETVGARHFTFVDEMISAKRFKKISEEILKRGLKLYFYALAKPTSDFTPEILKTMHEAGCRCIYWGFESGSERILELIDKGNTVEHSAETFHAAFRAGIRNQLFLIVGFPSENRKELRQTLDFLYENREVIDHVLGAPFSLYMGTPVFDRFGDFGIDKVYPTRSICNSSPVKYDLKQGISNAEAEIFVKHLTTRLFHTFDECGGYYGTIRDHGIIAYAKGDGPQRSGGKAVPAPDVIDRELDAGTDLKPMLFHSLKLTWNDG